MICPECKSRTSLFEKSCHICGYPLKNASRNRTAVFSFLAIFLVFVLGFFVLSFYDARPVVAAIDAIGEVSLESEDAILTAQSKYEQLNFFQKRFVYNHNTLTAAQSKFNSLPINLTPENALDYFDFNVIFSDLDVTDLSVYLLGIYQHSASANMEVVCSPKKDYYYEDTSVTLRYDLGPVYDWNASDITIIISSNGTGRQTNRITYFDTFTPLLPSSTAKFVVVNASGNIYKHQPD